MKTMKTTNTTNIYKNLNEKEFDLLLKLITQWYCKNDDTNLFSKVMHDLMLKIRAHNVKIPETLYRAYSFETKEDLIKFRKGISTKISHPTKDYESWTTSRSIAERYLPGSEYVLNKNTKFGILLALNKSDFEYNIKFTIEDLFSDKNDRNKFFKTCFSYLSTKMLSKIKDNNFNRKDIEEFQYTIPGIVRAVTEKEYLIEEIKNPFPTIIKEVG